MSELQLVSYSKLVDKIDWDNDIQRWTIRDNDLESPVFTASDACTGCTNNPKNGGSGICHCILGLTPIT
jgi:hypothetical protein